MILSRGVKGNRGAPDALRILRLTYRFAGLTIVEILVGLVTDAVQVENLESGTICRNPHRRIPQSRTPLTYQRATDT